MQKIFFMVMTSSLASQGDLKSALYVHVQVMLAPATSCKGDISSIHANILILFRGYDA